MHCPAITILTSTLPVVTNTIEEPMSCSIIMEEYVRDIILSKSSSFDIDNDSGSGALDCKEITDINNISIIQDNARVSRARKVNFVTRDNTNDDVRKPHQRRRRRSSRSKSSSIIPPKPTQKSRWESESPPPSSSPPKKIYGILLPRSMASTKDSSSSCRWASGVLHLKDIPTSMNSSSSYPYKSSNSARSVIGNIKAALESDLSFPQSSHPPRHQEQKQHEHHCANRHRTSLQNLSLPLPPSPRKRSARRTSSLISIPSREGSRHLLVRPERIPSDECICNNNTNNNNTRSSANQRDCIGIPSQNFRWGAKTNTSHGPTSPRTTPATAATH
jgi:hypothetical protein